MNDTDKWTINKELISQIKYDDKGLIPAIAQDEETNDILMVAYMNAESLNKTFETGNATFWSRSRQKLWMKGETSGNILKVEQILIDCDNDTLILKVIPAGPSCHTGERSCFYRTLASK
jgi:phosphoribosyl-AMP cyclohydrolase